MADILTLSRVESSTTTKEEFVSQQFLQTEPPIELRMGLGSILNEVLWFCRHGAKPAGPLLQQLNVLRPTVRSGRGINVPETVSCSLCKLLP